LFLPFLKEHTNTSFDTAFELLKSVHEFNNFGSFLEGCGSSEA
jgi:hypothetical protein